MNDFNFTIEISKEEFNDKFQSDTINAESEITSSIYKKFPHNFGIWSEDEITETTVKINVVITSDELTHQDIVDAEIPYYVGQLNA